MTDKEKIKKYLVDKLSEVLHLHTENAIVCRKVYQEVITFVDSMQEEPISEDLEEAAKHYLYSNILYDDVYVGNPTDKDCIEMFKAGGKWQMQQIIKDAVDGFVVCDGLTHGYKDIAMPIPYNLEVGDKVKLIIIKEGKQ